MKLIVRLKDGSATYGHEDATGREETLTLEDPENGTWTLSVINNEGGGIVVARYRLEAVDYWTTGQAISPGSPEAKPPSVS